MDRVLVNDVTAKEYGIFGGILFFTRLKAMKAVTVMNAQMKFC